MHILWITAQRNPPETLLKLFSQGCQKNADSGSGFIVLLFHFLFHVFVRGKKKWFKITTLTLRRRVLTIYKGKPKSLYGKSNGSRHSVWKASENMGYDLWRCNFSTLLSLYCWFGPRLNVELFIWRTELIELSSHEKFHVSGSVKFVWMCLDRPTRSIRLPQTDRTSADLLWDKRRSSTN